MQFEWSLDFATNGEKLKSCHNCRKSHSKCDSKQPCSNCSMRNLSCVYGYRKKPTFTNTEQVKRLEAELMKLKSQYERLQHSENMWKQKYQNLLASKQEPTIINEKKEHVEPQQLYNKYSVFAELYKIVQYGMFANERLPADVSYTQEL